MTLVAAVWAALASMLGAWNRRPELAASARNALWVTAGLATLSSALLLFLLFRYQFQVRYVYEHASTYLQPAYVLAAMWAGQEGSQLLWLWLLTICTGILLLRRPTRDRELRPYAVAFLALTQAFLALLLVSVNNPFELLPWRPVEGTGLRPLLQNFWMVVHPPIVFAAYALWTIPAAYALAALMTGRLDAEWLRATHRWTLAAWAALGTGILVGAWWAHLVSGWGGYWGWDPVENSSLIPWLVGSAFVHSAILQDRQGVFRTWNPLAVVTTFVLTVFATFVTRSGLIESVHAFGTSPIGFYYLGYMLLVLAVTIGLVLARRREPRRDSELGSLFSKESVCMLSNLLLLGLAAAVMIGTLWPTLREALKLSPRMLDAGGYNRFAGPLGLLLVMLLGLCPLVEWRTTALRRSLRGAWVPVVAAVLVGILLGVLGDWPWWAVLSFSMIGFAGASIVTEAGRGVAARVRHAHENPLVAAARAIASNRRRCGGQIVHLAVLLIVMGITGSQSHRQKAVLALDLDPASDTSRAAYVSGYTLEYRDFVFLESDEIGRRVRSQAVLDVSRNGRSLATLRPGLVEEEGWGVQPEVALHSDLRADLYVVLESLQADGLARFQVHVTAMVTWIWIGGGVLLLGALVAAWPTRRTAALCGEEREVPA